jgi:hypothetical protein
MASEMARLSTGHLALMLMTSAPLWVAASMPWAMVDSRPRKRLSTLVITMGIIRLFGATPATPMPLSMRPAMVPAISVPWLKHRPLVAQRAFSLPLSLRACMKRGATMFRRRSSCAASMPESTTATIRGSERAATPESQPIEAWPQSSSMHGSLGKAARADRIQQVETGPVRSSMDVARKSGPSQSGSA